ncbi:MAG: TolC family protein [Gemmatimonadota bacterium]|nr:TolC family protein [Gemmatimonadota bacterium]
MLDMSHNVLLSRAASYALAAALLSFAGARPLSAQGVGGPPRGSQRTLSLDDALSVAERASEDVGIARAGLDRARGEQQRARSQFLPQIGGTASYTRALASEFDDISFGPPDTRQPCRVFVPPGSGPSTGERLDSLERALALATDCRPTGGGGIDFSNLPFGRENTWRVGLDVSQPLFAGGRIVAQNRIATAGRRNAEIEFASTRAQVVLDVVQAYYDAVLTDRLYGIAQATLQQAETTLTQTRLARQVGTQPEFELLRAQVTRDNQLPVLVQRRTDREIAYLRLKQLLEIPLDEPLTLTSGLGDSLVATPARLASRTVVTPDTATEGRAPVRQAEELLHVQEGLLRVARSQRLPAVSVFSQYGRVGYPAGGVPAWNEFNSNWNVGVTLSLPLFTGGRIRGDELVARANLDEQRLRLQQVRELTTLDTRTALAQHEAAEASWQASAGTAEQAARAYQIAEVRFSEGISTQTELSDSRILLQQAQANRALAARDLQVARARLALLKDLPLAGLSGGASAPRGQQSPEPQGQQRPPQQSADQSQERFTGAGSP